jgi:hypothetical protein
MRYALMFLAIVATAQQRDPRGFVNERLLRPNFTKKLLFTPKLKPLPPQKPKMLPAKQPIRYLAGKPQDTACAIPLLEAQTTRKDADPKMVAPPSGNSGYEKMILPTIPICPPR